jgi:hypothetical protein
LVAVGTVQEKKLSSRSGPGGGNTLDWERPNRALIWSSARRTVAVEATMVEIRKQGSRR